VKKLNRKIEKRLLMILLLLFIVVLTACSIQKTIDIPEGNAPDREETYDDLVFCGRTFVYRDNCGSDWVVSNNVKESKVYLSGCIFDTDATYRNIIETTSGQVRYNSVSLHLRDGILRAIGVLLWYPITHSPIADYKIKLAGIVPDIQVRTVRETDAGIGSGLYGDEQIDLVIEISPQVKPGDYKLNFIVEANGCYCGELPCIIHVVE
jgi:hypothetical protein